MLRAQSDVIEYRGNASARTVPLESTIINNNHRAKTAPPDTNPRRRVQHLVRYALEESLVRVDHHSALIVLQENIALRLEHRAKCVPRVIIKIKRASTVVRRALLSQWGYTRIMIYMMM